MASSNKRMQPTSPLAVWSSVESGKQVDVRVGGTLAGGQGAGERGRNEGSLLYWSSWCAEKINPMYVIMRTVLKGLDQATSKQKKTFGSKDEKKQKLAKQP